MYFPCENGLIIDLASTSYKPKFIYLKKKKNSINIYQI